MYRRTNPAVIKSILQQFSKNELIQETEVLKSLIQEEEPGNKRTMFLNLYRFILNQLPHHAKKSNRKTK